MLPLLSDEARAAAEDPAATAAGYLDLLGPEQPESPGVTQDLMVSRVVPAIYERWWRPALGRVAKGGLGPSMSDEIRIARLLMGLSPGDGVLDVACGTGKFTRSFAHSVGESGIVVGLDLSEPMLRRAVEDTRRAGLPHVAYVRGDATDLPFRDASFDAVCCFAALNLMTDPMQALDSMTAVLTPGGQMALFTSCRGQSAPLRTLESLLTARSGLRMFERDELTDALKERGFVDIHQRITGLTQFVGGRLAD